MQTEDTVVEDMQKLIDAYRHVFIDFGGVVNENFRLREKSLALEAELLKLRGN